jgi:hypothetical protein
MDQQLPFVVSKLKFNIMGTFESASVVWSIFGPLSGSCGGNCACLAELVDEARVGGARSACWHRKC